jgi:beta-phosphoglucomutase-like phosphatase (HAD superfamily)
MDRIYTSLQTANIFSYFQKEHIFSAQQVKRRKPAPDIFLLAAERVGYEPKDCLVIEDSIYGVEGAQAAGMTAIGYVGGSHAHYPWFCERLEAYKIPVVDNFDAVRQYLN